MPGEDKCSRRGIGATIPITRVRSTIADLLSLGRFRFGFTSYSYAPVYPAQCPILNRPRLLLSLFIILRGVKRDRCPSPLPQGGGRDNPRQWGATVYRLLLAYAKMFDACSSDGTFERS